MKKKKKISDSREEVPVLLCLANCPEYSPEDSSPFGTWSWKYSGSIHLEPAP